MQVGLGGGGGLGGGKGNGGEGRGGGGGSVQFPHVISQYPAIQDSPHLPKLFCCPQVYCTPLLPAGGGVSLQYEGGAGGGYGGGGDGVKTVQFPHVISQ